MRALIFCLALTALSCGNIATRNSNEDQKVSFDWMLGSWTRTNDTSNNKTFENWKKISWEQYTGFGYTLNNGDTVFQENLRIFQEDRNWYFEVTEKTKLLFSFSLQITLLISSLQ